MNVVATIKTFSTKCFGTGMENLAFVFFYLKYHKIRVKGSMSRFSTRGFKNGFEGVFIKLGMQGRRSRPVLAGLTINGVKYF